MTAYLHHRWLSSSVARFLFSGGSATLMNLCLLWLLTRELGIWYLGASVCSYLVCVAYNFGMQRVWAFDGIGGAILDQFPKFVGVNLAGLMVNTAMLYVLVRTTKLPLVLCQAASSLVICGLSFVAYRRIFLWRRLPTATALRAC